MTAYKAFELGLVPSHASEGLVLMSTSAGFLYSVGNRYEMGKGQEHLYQWKIPDMPFFFFNNPQDPLGYASWDVLVKIEKHAPLIHYSKTEYKKRLLAPYSVSYLADWFELPQGAECYCPGRYRIPSHNNIEEVALSLGLKPIGEKGFMEWVNTK